MRRSIVVTAAVVAASVGIGVTGVARSQDKPAPAPEKKAVPAAPPNVAGAWTGVWGIYVPPPPGKPEPAAPSKYAPPQQQMDCKVEALPDGKWQATFEGECGKPYKYTIKMLGRTAGGSVMFQGSADLGAEDGGVFDWIGRATDKDFVGFFTSKGYTGTFRLVRPKEAAAAKEAAAKETAAKEAGPK